MIWIVGILIGWLAGSGMWLLWMMGRDTRRWSGPHQNRPLSRTASVEGGNLQALRDRYDIVGGVSHRQVNGHNGHAFVAYVDDGKHGSFVGSAAESPGGPISPPGPIERV